MHATTLFPILTGKYAEAGVSIFSTRTLFSENFHNKENLERKSQGDPPIYDADQYYLDNLKSFDNKSIR